MMVSKRYRRKVLLLPSTAGLVIVLMGSLARLQVDAAFVPRPQTSRYFRSPGPVRFSSRPPVDGDDISDDDDGDENDFASNDENGRAHSNADDMRSILESSWNYSKMGRIPTSPESAVDAASEAIDAAVADGNRLLMVDIRLPSFEISQGPNIYDEVAAVEFCTLLADKLRTVSKSRTDGGAGASTTRKALVLVKDGTMVRSVARVLEVKEKEKRIREMGGDGTNATASDSEREAEGFSPPPSVTKPTKSRDVDEADLNQFRKQLMAEWSADNKGEDDTPRTEIEKAVENTEEDRFRRGKDGLKASVEYYAATDAERPYRLASMFGDDDVSTGADVVIDAVQSVDVHGTMMNDENFLIILSPIKREETVAVRRLISRYSGTKTIVLVNSRLDPEPREMFAAVPAYFISPLIAKAVKSAGNFMSKQKSQNDEDEETTTKIVVMRRYPGDWEVFVDVDSSGFELVETAAASTVGKAGPEIDFIAGCVKRQMSFKFGLN